MRRWVLSTALLGCAAAPGVASAHPWVVDAAMVAPASQSPAQPDPPAATEGKPDARKPASIRIPKIPLGKQATLQTWTRLTVLSEWYRNNHNIQESDDGFVSLVSRLNLGVDTRLPRVRLGAQVRLDSQKIWFPAGQDCSGDCVDGIGDDFRLERATLRADTKRFGVWLGDYNVNFGRGMGLSVRKIDEIGVDATIKGGRADFHNKFLRATAIAGFSNRQNSDFATRQLLPDPGFAAQSYTFAQDAGDGACSTDGRLTADVGNPFWTECSDLLVGGRVEGKLPGKVDVGAHYVHIDFGDELTVGVIDEHLHLIGGDIARSRIAKVWDVFLGASGVVRNPQIRQVPEALALSSIPLEGYGVYSSNTLRLGETTVLAEGKHYRDYLVALTQNSLLQYTENPTLEREDQQVPGNINATGGRLRVDHLIRKRGLTLFINTLEYIYNDTVGLSQFTDENSRLATHNYGGIIWRKPNSDFVLQVSGGYRYERWRQTPDGLDAWVRRRFPHAEFYLTVPVGHSRGLVHALAFRGEGRWETLINSRDSQEQFFRGLFTLGYSLSPWFSISYLQGIDTEQPTPAGEPSLTDEECPQGANSLCRPHLWPGVLARINLFNSSFLRIFAGRQVGGRICVNGSCRTLPDFEGIRGEVVIAF
ncbi:MAG: hypothetical protein K0V04_46305 [Deltaproteobacteria bacterium]|nr:hypothetical protein [Deltaproteobacteria bacterium]